MLSRAQSITLILLTAFSAYFGVAWFWPLSNASPTRTPPAHLSPPAANQQSVSHHPTYAKSSDRDSPFTTYNNPGYNLSFRYPRTYSLTEDREDFGDDSSLKSQDQLTADQPGLQLLASIEIPDDAYPNTTFSSGHLQFAVNPTLSEPACRALAEPDDPDKLLEGTASLHESTGVEDIHALIFHWHQSRLILNHMDYLSRDYFAFSNGACYEFFLQTANIVPLPPDPPAAPSTPLAASTTPAEIAPQAHAIAAIAKADTKSLHTLERIVSTFELHH